MSQHSYSTLIPAFYHAWKTGFYPDGLPLRRSYTGIVPLDLIFVAYGGFFGAAVDGNDEATHQFCLWFLPQLCTLLVFAYWEAGRARSGLIQSATLACILAQLLTAGAVLPYLLASHILNIPDTPKFLQPDAPNRARTIFMAVLFGYLAPSLALIFPPPGISLDGVQIISAIWQPFPLYILVIWYFLRAVDSSIMPKIKGDESRQVLVCMKRSYAACALLSAASHLAVFLPSLVTTDPSRSFANVFIPYWMHSYLPIDLPAEPIAAYRPCGRLLFWHDWLIMTVAAVVFFARSRAISQHASVQSSLKRWIAHMVLIAMGGGPGAAVAWAAMEREERIALVQEVKQA
ncbi:hypothetical protein PHLGIDRAFT_168220 [Phlebiopsis gigantea 11061_1 CR5-6]|uniref:Uncharacterized protein n=1 Tax=Phlebiopsis gigantea (strain 11061_1 CR5-6) TaxID=745531 RepID=A0A0C3S4J1_PHLG1|nr:hypothetical protein PHLGIDRAFT_168220 [Phlebiopsis gigantea 11061_1 CR5-6]